MRDRAAFTNGLGVGGVRSSKRWVLMAKPLGMEVIYLGV